MPGIVALEARFGSMARARGSAVPLAGGLALTAAHVVDEASLREELCRLGRWPAEAAPYLAGLVLRGADGVAVPATRLRLGRSTFTPPAGSIPAGTSVASAGQGCDLAYRDGQLRRGRMAGWPDGRMAGEAAEAEAANGRYAVLALRLEPGDSGGGVFDAASGCLLGIVSMRDPAAPGRTWLVRAAVIRAFLAEE